MNWSHGILGCMCWFGANLNMLKLLKVDTSSIAGTRENHAIIDYVRLVQGKIWNLFRVLLRIGFG